MLRRTGYTDNAIDAWLGNHGCLDVGERHKHTLDLMSGKAAQKAQPTCEPRTGKKSKAQDFSIRERELNPEKMPESGERLTKNSPCLVESFSDKKSDVASPKVGMGTCTKTSLSGYPDSTTAPCRLLTLLAKNSTADITQVSLSTQSDKQPCEINAPDDYSFDGVECSTAYKCSCSMPLLMRKCTKLLQR